MIAVWISETAHSILALDATATDRAVREARQRRRGWGREHLVEGEPAALRRLAAELDDVSRGALGDEHEQPARRAAARAARRINEQLAAVGVEGAP